jgi:hypothetical protein
MIVREFNIQINVEKFHNEFDRHIEKAKEKYGDFTYELSVNTDNNKSIVTFSNIHCDSKNKRQLIEDDLMSVLEKIVTSQMK